ncbi:MAG: DUF116 domain-containing protein [Candidatus Krumholzibacteriota bacterium]|nr:DUF116 domain-containing protein [Candidatus Krumholzibacteriota bacterium]
MPEPTKDKSNWEKRLLGDEWLDWNDENTDASIQEGKRTFLILSLIIIAGFILLALLFWYLILPRIASFGYAWTVTISGILILLAVFLILWYILLFITVISGKQYLIVCLTQRNRLLFALLPLAARLASSLGISRDRLSHSFIMVSNTLVKPGNGPGPVLVLFPRCLKKEIKEKAKEISSSFPQVITNTAPGGGVARRIIRETSPRAIIAIACERDLISGIQDVAPRIPVIGIPNNRPEGPCKDTEIDLESLSSALKLFCATGPRPPLA